MFKHLIRHTLPILLRLSVLYSFVYVVLLLLLSLGVSSKKELATSDFILQEKTNLEDLHVKCLIKSSGLTKNSVCDVWSQNQVLDGTLLCLLNFLEKKPDDVWVWSMLGTSFDLRNQKQKGDYCFKQSKEVGGKHSPFVQDWHFIGPFVIGKTEFDGDPLAAFGGIRNISKFRFSSSPVAKYFTETVPGGEISWEVTKQNDADSMVQVKPKVNWNDLVSSLGSLGITEWQGWAVGNIFINEDTPELSFQCLGVARCYVGKFLIAGDLYQRNKFWFPVALSRGVHSIFIPLRAKVNSNFQFSLMKLTNFKVLKPPFLPDIQKRYLASNTIIPIPISNFMSKRWLKVTSIKVQNQSKGIALVASLALTYNVIAPGQTKVLAVLLQVKDTLPDLPITSSCLDIDLELKIQTSEGPEHLPITLRCRNQGSSFLFTFIDHDGSVQHAAAVEPIAACPNKVCPVFLTLHGTTVPPQNQADSHKKMVRGEFEFGISKMWLLAPTRHGAHNWEGPGALTALSALQALYVMTQSSSWLGMIADPNKVLFAGHSMGGHGAWHLATHFPDMAIGLISLAGWIKKEEYGDSNLFFRHDIASSHTDPAVKAIMEACIMENDADKLVTNLKGIPVLARIGANDRTVHPYFVRRMVRLLKESDIEVTYTELANLDHWWWDTKETNDGGCVNDAQIRKFISKIGDSLFPKEFCSKEDDDSCTAAMDEKANSTFKLVTMNPAFGDGLKGVSVLQQSIPFRQSLIEINVNSDILTLKTQNVGCLQIKKDLFNHRLNGPKIIIIDGLVTELAEPVFPLIFCLQEETSLWTLTNDWENLTLSGLVRGPHNYGPARRIAERPFLIVVGTQADKETSALLLRHAAYIANQFFLTSDTAVTVLEDTNVDGEKLDEYNMILIGSPAENLLTTKYLNSLRDLQLAPRAGSSDSSTLTLGRRCTFSSPNVGVMALAPNGRGLALLLMGLSAEGLEDIVNLATPTIPPMARSPFSNLLPDFVVTGPDTKLKGPGGFLCIGFWDNNWRLSSSSASCVC